MAVLDEDFQRLWGLLAELSSQLTANREQCEALKRQASDLKDSAVHAGTGYVLRRFNVDLSKEVFESELERMNANLVVENQTLQYENRQLSVLLKEYEGTLEQVMSRFRTHAHSSQTHEVGLVKYYESALVSALERCPADPTPPPLDPLTSALDSQGPLSTQPTTTTTDPKVLEALEKLSDLVAVSLRLMSGELSDESMTLPHSPPPPPPPPAPPGESPPTPPTKSNVEPNPASFPLPSSPSTSSYVRRPNDPSQGGYVGSKRATPVGDWALEVSVEIESLEAENRQLRELLWIADSVEGEDFVMPRRSTTRKRNKQKSTSSSSFNMSSFKLDPNNNNNSNSNRQLVIDGLRLEVIASGDINFDMESANEDTDSSLSEVDQITSEQSKVVS